MKLKYFIPVIGISEFVEDYMSVPHRERNPFLLVAIIIIHIQVYERLHWIIGTAEYTYMTFFANN